MLCAGEVGSLEGFCDGTFCTWPEAHLKTRLVSPAVGLKYSGAVWDQLLTAKGVQYPFWRHLSSVSYLLSLQASQELCMSSPFLLVNELHSSTWISPVALMCGTTISLLMFSQSEHETVPQDPRSLDLVATPSPSPVHNHL